MSTPHKPHGPGFLALTADAKKLVKELSIGQYKEQYLTGAEPEHLLVDVREDREWAEGHAKGAIHLSRGIIERDIETTVPDKNTKIVCYCGGGYRSALVAESLGKMGYTDVWSLNGGWREWTAAGLPAELPPEKK
ncbi:MAG: rhodanese-like domain-containing protein [Bryobacteraceae bacterium]